MLLILSAVSFTYQRLPWQKGLTVPLILLTLIFSCWTIEANSVWSDSLGFWGATVKKSPNKARPHNNLGVIYERKGMLDEAVKEYKTALAIKPNYATAHCNLGNAYAKKGMLDIAILEYEKALGIKDDYADAYYNLGNAYAKKGMFSLAIAEWKRALNVSPDYAKAHFNMGVAYEYNKNGIRYGPGCRLDEAISEYKKALDTNPNWAVVHKNLAIAYFYKGAYRESIEHSDRAMKLGCGMPPQLIEALGPHRPTHR
jgi:tetratricopeptide (TPR) repeat protein